MTVRAKRQGIVARWCKKTFGVAEAGNLAQRGIRFFEESCELSRATGVTREMAHRMVDYEWDRAPGTIAQELGGVGVTVLALAAAANLDADDCERNEVGRVLSKSAEHFMERNQVKNLAGFRA